MNRIVPHSRPTLGAGEADAARRVVASGQLSCGDETRAFEEEVAEFVGRRHAVAVSSGTAALHLALTALDACGSEVLFPSYVCSALLHATRAAGARPVVCDIDAKTSNIDGCDAVRRASAASCATIVPHMFGLPAAIPEFSGKKMAIVEDCAMAIGAYSKRRPVGSHGEISICSFFATKVICSGGEGGMLLTDDRGLAERARDAREYDSLPANQIRYNYKMTEIAAAVGRVQLRRLPEFVARRQEIAHIYHRRLRQLDVKLPENDEHIYFRYVIQGRLDAKDFVLEMERLGVRARRPVFRPLHSELGCSDDDFPSSAAAHRRQISLPLYPSLDEEEIDQVVEAVSQVSMSNQT
jgi:perosamine synthetase